MIISIIVTIIVLILTIVTITEGYGYRHTIDDLPSDEDEETDVTYKERK